MFYFRLGERSLNKVFLVASPYSMSYYYLELLSTIKNGQTVEKEPSNFLKWNEIDKKKLSRRVRVSYFAIRQNNKDYFSINYFSSYKYNIYF